MKRTLYYNALELLKAKMPTDDWGKLYKIVRHDDIEKNAALIKHLFLKYLTVTITVKVPHDLTPFELASLITDIEIHLKKRGLENASCVTRIEDSATGAQANRVDPNDVETPPTRKPSVRSSRRKSGVPAQTGEGNSNVQKDRQSGTPIKRGKLRTAGDNSAVTSESTHEQSSGKRNKKEVIDVK